VSFGFGYDLTLILVGTIASWITNNTGLAIVIIIGMTLVFIYGFNQCMQKMRADKRMDIIAQARLETDEMARFARIEKQQFREDRQRRQQMADKRSSRMDAAAPSVMKTSKSGVSDHRTQIDHQRSGMTQLSPSDNTRSAHTASANRTIVDPRSGYADS
jgi:hypothetical protein